MELAGLACAQALAKVYRNDVYPRVLVCCGPGNQGMFPSSDTSTRRFTFLLGGDGLVAARHLGELGGLKGLQVQIHHHAGMFGYRPTVYMPKVGSPNYERSTYLTEMAARFQGYLQGLLIVSS